MLKLLNGKLLSDNTYSESTSQRNFTIDILRAGALFYVVGYWHLFEYSDALNYYKNSGTSLITNCFLGLFIFLSGLLLAQRYSFKSRKEVITFYQRRFFRIYPMYLIALVLFWVTKLIGPVTFFRSIFITNIFPYIPLMTLWFISVILVLYGLTPLYLYRYNLTKTLVLSLFLCSLLFTIALTKDAVDLRLPLYLPAFVYGIIIARHFWARRLFTHPITALCGAGLWYLTFTLYKQIEFTGLWKLLINDVAILLSMPVLWAIASLLVPLFQSNAVLQRLLKAISYSSFAAYLIHRLTFSFGQTLYEPPSPTLSLAYWLGIVLPVTLLISYGFQAVYDAILNYWTRRSPRTS